LSIQAASDTLGDTERGFIDKEVQQLRAEIDRIANATEYNGLRLLNGQGDVLDIQVGQNNNPELDRFQFDLSKTDVTSARLGVGSITVTDKASAQSNLETIDGAIKTLSENRAELGALQNRLQSNINSLNIYDESLSAVRSRIYDVDMASETAELTKSNILSAAGTSVLSQANQNNMLALKLIG
jgi:flagellin